MPSRSRVAKAPAQTRMAEIITAYINYLSCIQVSQDTEVLGVAVRAPNDRFPSFDNFCAQCEPGISLAKYADRLVTYMHCSPEVFIYAMAYIRRLLIAGCPLHSRSIHRILLTATVVAAKIRDDHYWSMDYYAQVGGVNIRDLNTMELRFLADLIDFRAEVLPEEYREVVQSISLATKLMSLQSGAVSETASSCVSSSPSASEDNKKDSGNFSAFDWVTECEVYW